MDLGIHVEKDGPIAGRIYCLSLRVQAAPWQFSEQRPLCVIHYGVAKSH